MSVSCFTSDMRHATGDIWDGMKPRVRGKGCGVRETTRTCPDYIPQRYVCRDHQFKYYTAVAVLASAQSQRVSMHSRLHGRLEHAMQVGLVLCTSTLRTLETAAGSNKMKHKDTLQRD